MIDLRSVRQLARYRLWADRLTFDAVAALPPGEAVKERPTRFKTMVGTLNHTYLVDLIWQAHLEGRDHGFQALDLALHEGLPELWRAQQAINQWYVDWSDGQSARSLEETVRFRFVDGERGAMTQGEILLHVVNHATYHRGWVAEMFFQVPARNPTTDLPVYLGSLGLERTESRSRIERKTGRARPIPLPGGYAQLAR
jgi:uncharacterized damage-inducible protein DinB